VSEFASGIGGFYTLVLVEYFGAAADVVGRSSNSGAGHRASKQLLLLLGFSHSINVYPNPNPCFSFHHSIRWPTKSIHTQPSNLSIFTIGVYPKNNIKKYHIESSRVDELILYCQFFR
jgi:hypothetical protein